MYIYCLSKIFLQGFKIFNGICFWLKKKRGKKFYGLLCIYIENSLPLGFVDGEVTLGVVAVILTLDVTDVWYFAEVVVTAVAFFDTALGAIDVFPGMEQFATLAPLFELLKLGRLFKFAVLVVLIDLMLFTEKANEILVITI